MGVFICHKFKQERTGSRIVMGLVIYYAYSRYDIVSLCLGSGLGKTGTPYIETSGKFCNSGT